MSAYAPMALHLQTDRLTLRPWVESDAESLCALAAERERVRAGQLTLDRAREIIAAGQARREETGLDLLPIRRREEGDFIGYCGLLVGRASVDEPEIGYELLRSTHGHGYATEAARAAVAAAAATGRKRLRATVRAWNAPSFRVLEKLGFERDHVTTLDDGDELVWLTRSLGGAA